jgi:serine/threonine-protein kinase
MLQKGQIFNNRYKIISTLGEGGFGAVYKVWDDNLQRHCAIKENLQVSPEAQKQFKREAIMLANLNHPHLVRVTDYFFIADQGQYLVMDFVDGNDLQTILTDNGGPLPAEQALAWIRQVCDALIYIHSQNPPIIHRDIKPANIRVTPQGNAVLVDFGLAKSFDVGMKTSMGARGLTPHFAAPEQYGMGGTDAQSDIYSLGVTLYCLLTYSVPPDSVEIMVGNAEPPSPANVIHNSISDSVSDALQRAMQIRRTERYKSVTDFKNALSAPQVVQIVSPAYRTPAQVDTSANKFSIPNMEFVRVPAGKFLMGSNNNDEKPQHTVELSEYFIGKYPVTNLEYQAFVRDAKYKSPEGWNGDQFPAKKGNHPVVRVSWNDARAFCKWLSQKTGKQHRLPTEAEWEKAARGTDGRKYPWGNDAPNKGLLNYNYNVGDTNEVGKYPAGKSIYNAYDMAGNVWEWVNDWDSDTYYKSSPSSNPLGPDSGGIKVLRGGSWSVDVSFVRSAIRFGDVPSETYYDYGFRCARSLP